MTKPVDDLVWCGTTEDSVVFDSTTHMLPPLADADLVLQTACLRPVTPDNVVDGLYITTGGGRQGIMMRPGMGRTIADLIADGTTDVKMTPYNSGRCT
jgi:glycine/D-amino acid oxidase-like deaminating enzyme